MKNKRDLVETVFEINEELSCVVWFWNPEDIEMCVPATYVELSAIGAARGTGVRAVPNWRKRSVVEQASRSRFTRSSPHCKMSDSPALT